MREGLPRPDGPYLATPDGLYQRLAAGLIDPLTLPVVRLAPADPAAAAVFAAARTVAVGALLVTPGRPLPPGGWAAFATWLLTTAQRSGYAGPLVLVAGPHRLRPTPTARRWLARLVAAGLGQIDLHPAGPAAADQAAGAAALLRSLESDAVSRAIGAVLPALSGEPATAVRAFLERFVAAYVEALPRLAPGPLPRARWRGLSTLALPLPPQNGSPGPVTPDLDRLAELARLVREEYGLAGLALRSPWPLSDHALRLLPTVGCATVTGPLVAEPSPTAWARLFTWLRLAGTVATLPPLLAPVAAGAPAADRL